PTEWHFAQFRSKTAFPDVPGGPPPGPAIGAGSPPSPLLGSDLPQPLIITVRHSPVAMDSERTAITTGLQRGVERMNRLGEMSSPIAGLGKDNPERARSQRSTIARARRSLTAGRRTVFAVGLFRLFSSACRRR